MIAAYRNPINSSIFNKITHVARPWTSIHFYCPKF